MGWMGIEREGIEEVNRFRGFRYLVEENELPYVGFLEINVDGVIYGKCSVSMD